jgi:ceramide glucosyltransferase
MIPLLHAAPALLSAGVACAGIAQAVQGAAAVRRFAASGRRLPPDYALPPVTVLKPLYGADAGLAQALESFFALDYPVLQLVFGVQRHDDPAIAVVEALCDRYPHVDAILVCDATPHGANRKIANLINMFPHAAHDVLLISDSDMQVAADYLHHVAAALDAPDVGLVTTIYSGLPIGQGGVAQLGAAYITQIFASGALMARSLGRRDCMGATMCLRRDTLLRIGGLPALSPYVADDGVLGKKVLALGLDVALANSVPATTVCETRLPDLFSHELRWARTIRAMAPIGFVLSALQYPVAWALLSTLLSPSPGWSLGLLAAACLSRAAAGRIIETALRVKPTAMLLAPLRDLVSMSVFCTAFFGDKVAWNGFVLSTAPDRALSHENDVYAIQAAAPVLAHGEG